MVEDKSSALNSVQIINTRHWQPHTFPVCFARTCCAWGTLRFPRYVPKMQLNLKKNSMVSLQEGAWTPLRLFSSMCSSTGSYFGQSVSKSVGLSPSPHAHLFEMTHSHLFLASEICLIAGALLCLPRDSEGCKGHHLNVSRGT